MSGLYLHWTFRGENILLPFIVLDSLGGFVMACLMTVVICVSERALTFAIDTEWEPHSLKLCRRLLALWRAWMYSIVTSLRIAYMLITMTLHVGLVFVIIITLASAQFVFELQKLPKPPSLSRNLGSDLQPLLSNKQPLKTRPRSKSKPGEIFIHPAESNIVRADAVALELGLGHNSYPQAPPAWETGRGKDLARQMLGKPAKPPNSRHQPQEQFFIGRDSPSDCESD